MTTYKPGDKARFWRVVERATGRRVTTIASPRHPETPGSGWEKFDGRPLSDFLFVPQDGHTHTGNDCDACRACALTDKLRAACESYPPHIRATALAAGAAHSCHLGGMTFAQAVEFVMFVMVGEYESGHKGWL